MELAAGDRVDRYVLRVRLGEGGQGEVWRADDPIDAEHPKAVKLVGVASATPNQLERLRREARRLVQLKHPSLIACHGLFEDLHRDLLGVVMEYADGQSLDDAMADARMTEDRRMLVLAHVAGALAYVHQRNVVHRDIKLENVVVTHAFWDAPQDPRTVKLIDFGIAVESDNPKPLTQIGCVIGTPPYLAPELIDPSGWNSVGGATPTSDVFAFGVLAWKLLLGASAHPSGLPGRSNMGEYAVAYRASAGGPWPPETPQAVWVPVISRCLALDPRERIKDGLELVSDLAKAMPGVVLPTAEHAMATPVAGEKIPATAAPAARPASAGPRTETAQAPAPLRESTPQRSARTVPQAPDLARWLPVGAPGPARPFKRRKPIWWIALAVALPVSFVVWVALAFVWHEGRLRAPANAGSSVPSASQPEVAPRPNVASPAIEPQPGATRATPTETTLRAMIAGSHSWTVRTSFAGNKTIHCSTHAGAFACDDQCGINAGNVLASADDSKLTLQFREFCGRSKRRSVDYDVKSFSSSRFRLERVGEWQEWVLDEDPAGWAAERQLGGSTGDLEATRKKEAELEKALSNAKDEAERAKIEAQLANAKKADAGAYGAREGTGHAGETATPKCNPGDPLCGSPY